MFITKMLLSTLFCTKSTFQYMNIKMAFMIAYMVAKEDCECGCHYDILQNKVIGVEHCILKRIFNSVKRFSDANKTLYKLKMNEI